MTGLGGAVLRALASSSPRPLTLRTVAICRRLSWGDDPLSGGSEPHAAADLEDPSLRQLLADFELGTWALGPSGITWLEGFFMRARPNVVVEFGSGASTMCFAHWLRQAQWAVEPVVVSFEQDREWCALMRERVNRLEGSTQVHVVHAPLEHARVRGHAASTYSGVQESLDRLIGHRNIDLAFVDGPAAEAGARFNTLPLIASRVGDHSVWAVDDALRDGELRAGRAWERLPEIVVEGIVPVGHGVMMGRFATRA